MGPTRETELANEAASAGRLDLDLFDMLPCGIHGTDVHGTITHSNLAHHRMLGYADGQLIGRSVWSILDSEADRTENRDYIAYLVEHQPPPTPYITRNRKADGGVIEVQINWRYKRDASEQVEGFLCVVADVTELRAAANRSRELEAANEALRQEVLRRQEVESRLARREREVAQIIDSVPAMISYLDADERYRFVNRKYEEMMGRSRRKIIGKTLREVVGESNYESGHKHVVQALAGERTYLEREVFLQGKHLWLSTELVPDVGDGGAIEGVFVLITDLTDRKRIETALQESEELFRTVFESAPIGISLVGPGLEVWRVNNAMCRMLGYSEAELQAVGIAGLMHPEEVESGMTSATQLLAGQIPAYQTERRYIHKNGSVISANVIAAVAQDKSRATRFTIGMAEDITARREVEQAGRESEARFRSVFENSSVGIALIRPDQQILEVNAAFCRMLGCSRSEILSRPSNHWTHSDDRLRYAEENDRLFRGEVPVLRSERRYLHSNGSIVEVQNSASIVEGRDGKPLYAVVILEDVTKINKTRKAQRRLEENLRLMADHATDVIYRLQLEPERRYDYISPSCTKTFGYTPEEFYAEPDLIIKLIHPDDRSTFTEGMDTTGLDLPARARMIHKDGRTVTLDINRVVTRSEEGTPLFMDGIARDVTERVRSEEALQRSAQLAATGRLAAGIAHEINNPLAGIKNAFSLVKGAVPRDHPHIKYVGLIDDEIRRIASIVSGMFDLFRPPPDGHEKFQIGETLKAVVLVLEPAIEERGTSVVVEMDDGDQAIFQPESLVRQILLNVVKNAVEATEKGPNVRIRCERTRDLLKIRVENPGPSIPAKLADRIFEPFFTTKSGSTDSGLGMGLSVSRSIAESLGGSLSYAGHPHLTIFELTLPIRDTSMRDASSGASVS